MEQHVHLADGPGDLLLHRTARLGLPRLKMAARSCFTVGAAALRARRGRALGVNDGGRTRARQRGSSKRRLQCGFSGPRVLARPLGEVPLRHWRSPQPRCGAIEEPPQILGRRSQEDCREPRVVVGVRGGGSQLTGDPQRHDQDVAPLSGKRRSKRRTATPSLVFHPAAPDPRIHETGYRVGAWRWPRGRFLYGAESPFFSLTRSPASTPYCETGSSGERAV